MSVSGSERMSMHCARRRACAVASISSKLEVWLRVRRREEDFCLRRGMMVLFVVVGDVECSLHRV